MKEGDIVLTPLLQSDGQYKNRPALLLKKMPPYGDFLVCGISTQLHQEVKNFDEVITRESEDFGVSGLKMPSLVRLGFLAVLPAAQFQGSIGQISETRLSRLRRRLSDLLQS